MSIPGAANPLLLRSAASAGGYVIPRSLRVNSSDSAYLSRTPASAGNRKTWTWAGWVKASRLGTYRGIFEGYTGSPAAANRTSLQLANADQIDVLFDNTSSGRLTTTQVFRDPSAWYHIVFACDTTQATASNRFKIYINGSQVTTFAAATYPSQNYDTGINTTQAHYMGRVVDPLYADFYLADIHFIDGQALTPSSFTEVSATTGRLEPKAYSGPTPTGNSFWLPFSDSSAATATTLGKDGFLLGNNWTPNNLSVTAGVGTSITGLAAYGTVTSPQVDQAFNGTAPFSAVFGGRPNGVGASFNGVTAQNKVRVLASSESGQIQINNSINTGLNSAWPTFAWLDVSSSLTFPFTLTAVGYSGGRSSDGGYISAVEVDNKLLVTASVANPIAAGNDSLVDTPSSGSQVDTGLGGQVTGNYATLNPLDKRPEATLSEGNLRISSNGSFYRAKATAGVSSGKWYWEVIIQQEAQGRVGVGIANPGWSFGEIGQTAGEYAYFSGGFKSNAGAAPAYGSTYTVDDVIGVALDMDAGSISFYKNGASQGVAFSGISGPMLPAIGSNGGAAYTFSSTFNFGARPFSYPAPAGFKCLVDTNLPVVIAKPSTAMDVALWTGDTSTTRSITGLNFSPDLVWIKNRGSAYWNVLFDAVRGAGNQLSSNQTDAELASASNVAGKVSSFDANGFTLASGSSGIYTVNENAKGHVAWCWDAGSSTVTNTQGSITSSVRANPSAGFSVVTYTGTGANATVGHGLGVAPDLIIVKSRSAVSSWRVWNRSVYTVHGATYFLNLNEASSALTNALIFNSGNPSSTTFPVGASSSTNGSSQTYVAYCFAPVAGYSAFGSYTGNGSASDGPFVYTGMRPRYLCIKSTSFSDQWIVFDSARNTSNVVNLHLHPNLANNESSFDWLDFTSNGFKIRTTYSTVNQSSASFIYFAFAESPFAYSRAR